MKNTSVKNTTLLVACLALSGGVAQTDEKLGPDHATKMADGLALFKSKVRAILVQSCVDCHGGKKTRAKLDLVSRAALVRGGSEGPAIVPGSHEKSRLFQLVAHRGDPHMPHKKERLPDADIAAIGRWIDLGAPYDAPLVDGSKKGGGEMVITGDHRDWWAFRPLAGDVVPATDDPWCRTPVDRFVLRKLREKGLRANDIAEPRTLLRRVYLDLIGMPPPVDIVEGFAANPTFDRYTQIVDQLLDSPHHGERWARHWLDVARFAESHGFEHDYDRKFAYHFRDFVIRALNADMPYDRFVRWQLAGDELAPDDSLAMMATGFLGAGVFPTQITKKEVERTRYDALDDMAATTGTAFLGLTIGCARCHDHKFDAIPTRDYYRLLSTFTTTVRSEVDLPVNSPKYREEIARFEKENAPLIEARDRFEREELPARLASWIDKRRTDDQPQATWSVLDLTGSRSHGGASFRKLDDGSLLAQGKNPQSDTYTLVAETKLLGITAIRLEALSHPSMARGGPGRAPNGNFGLSRIRLQAGPAAGDGETIDVPLVSPVVTFEQNKNKLSIASSLDNDKSSGWAVDPQFGKDHAAVFQTTGNVGLDSGTKLTFTLEFQVNGQHNIGRPRLSVSTRPQPVGLEGDATPSEIIEILARVDSAKAGSGADKLSGLPDADRARLLAWYRHLDDGWRELDARVRALAAKKPTEKKMKVQVTTEGAKPMRHHSQGADFFKTTHFLDRGDTDQKREAVSQSFLRVLMRNGKTESHWQEPAPKDARTSYRRRALAGWITDTEHGAGHLLARVIVNRLWQHHFGRGIVSTPNDFGHQGDRPSHPGLLDWLARHLIEGGWRLKPIHRLMLTSAVYVQSSDSRPDRRRADDANRWHWRHTPRRLEAEAIRDSLLAVSAALDRTMFGPGTLDEGMTRRSIYFTVKRSRLIPTLQLFDAPESLVSLGQRPTTTIAPQALHLMNNPHVRDYARRLAGRLELHAKTSPTTAIVYGYMTTLSRPPEPSELARSVAFVETQRKRYADEKRKSPLNLALADFCQVLFGLNEFVYVY